MFYFVWQCCFCLHLVFFFRQKRNCSPENGAVDLLLGHSSILFIAVQVASFGMHDV